MLTYIPPRGLMVEKERTNQKIRVRIPEPHTLGFEYQDGGRVNLGPLLHKNNRRDRNEKLQTIFTPWRRTHSMFISVNSNGLQLSNGGAKYKVLNAIPA
jgi:hypothetical protein